MRINPEALKAIREKDGHSQLSLAKHSGVAQSRISGYESGKSVEVRPGTVKRLAEALGVSMSALVAA